MSEIRPTQCFHGSNEFFFFFFFDASSAPSLHSLPSLSLSLLPSLLPLSVSAPVGTGTIESDTLIRTPLLFALINPAIALKSGASVRACVCFVWVAFRSSPCVVLPRAAFFVLFVVFVL